MKFFLTITIFIFLGQSLVLAQSKNKASKTNTKKSSSNKVQQATTSEKSPKKETTVVKEVTPPSKPIPQHTLNDLDLNCLNRGNAECRTKEGSKCELLAEHASEIVRLQLDPDSTPHTFIAENKYKKCESYWVTEQCRILGADICDAEQKLKLFGPPPIEESSFFNSSFFD